jgi:hypothetical protein
MAKQPLTYREFASICHAMRRIRKVAADPDLYFIRDALATSFQKENPDLASRLSRLTIPEMETLLAHVERFNAAS